MNDFNNLKLNEAVEYLCKNNKIIKEVEHIKEFNSIKLLTHGEENVENYQIFTPKFIVADMVKGIGIENITNLEYTILEPTSGDGAFTTYILEQRIRKYLNEKEKIFYYILKSLSTLYSVEMDRQLLLRQRCNIYTTIINLLNEINYDLSAFQENMIKYMIVTNFIWGCFNIEEPIYTIFNSTVVYKMPRKKNIDEIIEFPVWKISEDLTISLHYEGVDRIE